MCVEGCMCTCVEEKCMCVQWTNGIMALPYHITVVYAAAHTTAGWTYTTARWIDVLLQKQDYIYI